ncbi:acyltransferase [Agrococcus sp. ARC_14]|uniref:acyltransferase family protein n=1 Tax=Agrococcus sp. ARC_14 TaxID=2919927 RepID=UPI001F05D81E|nr:acyltransferase [Agrococcus sp. ARC_14]MCH1882188.1 acyltransferase [Agrococcus sp. ARC_14]
MTTMLERATTTTRADAVSRGRRDASVDLVRALCLLVVVGLHAMMVGVSVVDGAPVIENAMDRWEGFPLASWVVQVMPLFFVLGGFSAHRQWTGMRARDRTAADYLATRLRRLLPPVIGAVAVTALSLAALVAAGVPAELVGEAGFRLSQPLWFMGVYLLCTLLVPVMVRMHEVVRVRTTLALAGAALGIDVLRAATGVDAIGFANLLLVWLSAQQLGFWIADGSVDRWSRAVLLRLGAGALALAIAVCAAGLSTPDLFQALNPPSVVLVLLGVAQAAAMVMVRDRLRRIAGARVVARAVGAINARAMTIYSWHMLVLIGLAGASLVSPALLPEPLSDAWWQSRPLWLLAVGVATIAVVRMAGVLETGALAARIAATVEGAAPRAAGMVAAYLFGAAGVLAVLVFGSLPAVWAVAALVLGASLMVARGAQLQRASLRRASVVP